ncbi:MAG: hypothetical protein V3T90_03935 [Anaerolineae bacterium]
MDAPPREARSSNSWAAPGEIGLIPSFMGFSPACRIVAGEGGPAIYGPERVSWMYNYRALLDENPGLHGDNPFLGPVRQPAGNSACKRLTCSVILLPQWFCWQEVPDALQDGRPLRGHHHCIAEGSGGLGAAPQAPRALGSPVSGLNEESPMAESPSVPPASTFVVRFWREWLAAGSRWRGRVEHVQSGESAAFLDLNGMLDFVRRFGAMADDEREPAGEDE